MIHIKQLFTGVFLWLWALGLGAQIRGEEIRVLVSPDHADWCYQLGEKCTFTVRVLRAQNLVPDARIDYELGPEFFPAEAKKSFSLKNREIRLSATMKEPGFLRCKVKATVDGRSYTGLATCAYAADRLQPVTPLPEDFQSYWEGQLAYARQTPLDLKKTLLPERCTATDDVYHVSFQTLPWGGRFYGILTVPKKEGRYPALLRVPGAGVRPYSGDTYTAPGRLIVLEVGIHGIPVTMEQPIYDALMAGALNDYPSYGCDNRDRHYYRRVIIGAARAVDVICSLPQYNGEALAVCGSSQGGALSIITAALDRRVTCLAPVHPALCDHEGFLQHRAGGWPHFYHRNATPSEQMKQTLRYYDVANFARLLSVPGWYSWGYNDEVCPPTSMYAAYNVIKAPKELHLYLETGHYWYQEQWDEWQKWIREQLKIAE